MTELNHDLPEYIGGDAAPADLWGAAPERGDACAVVENATDLWTVGHSAKVPAYVIVDALIDAGLLANETGPGSHRFLTENLPRRELVRRCKALYAEQFQTAQTLAAALGLPKGDGRYCPRDEYMVIDDTPVTLAEKVAALIAELRDNTRDLPEA